jgi:hypothetical protein
MKRDEFSARRRQVLAMGMIGAGAMVVPPALAAAPEPVVQLNGSSMVLSGRIVAETDGHALYGAKIEVWQADARGARLEATREVAVTDGDGRYFAVLKSAASRLHYRVSHKDYTTKVTQLNLANARQRTVTLTRDRSGTTRVAFELALVPRNQQVA